LGFCNFQSNSVKVTAICPAITVKNDIQITTSTQIVFYYENFSTYD